MLTYWKPIAVLLRLRRQAAVHDLATNPTAFLGRALLALILLFVGWTQSSSLGRQWTELSPLLAETRLNRLWLQTQMFWMLALLVPGIVSLLGRSPGVSVLRAFPLRPSQTLLAALLGSLCDTPTLIAVSTVVPFLSMLCLHGHGAEAVVAAIAFVLLGLLTVALVHLVTAGSTLLTRRMRRLSSLPMMPTLCLFGLCVCVPPAFASLTVAPQNPKAFHLHLPSMPTVSITPMLPSSFASRSVLAARRADIKSAAGSLAVLTVMMLCVVGTALAFHRSISPLFSETSFLKTSKTRQRLPPSGQRATVLSQLFALTVTDGRLLLRNPGTYLPLRQPAALVLLGVLAFVAPDMGKYPVYSLKSLLGLGGILYNILWQIQLLCNRFGTEAGTATMLLSLSAPRWMLLLGKNLSLFLLLIGLDSIALAALCVVGEASANIPRFLLWLPLTLVVLTALGNIVSVALPFPIVRKEDATQKDAPEGLAFGYGCIGTAAGVLLIPAARLFSYGVWGVTVGLTYVLLLYVSSLWIASTQIKKLETDLMTRLDRNGR
jgi:hypothetical protein